MIQFRLSVPALTALVVLSVALVVPIDAKERVDESKVRSNLQQFGQRLLEIRNDFLDFGKLAKGETQFNLYYVSKEAEVTFLNVYHVRTILDLAVVAQSQTDEPVIRFVLAREAKDLVSAVDRAITATKSARTDLEAPDHLKRLDDFLSLLRELRPVAERISNEK